jgi:hypothetical protein
MNFRSSLLYLSSLIVLASAPLSAQQAPPAPDTSALPKIGDVAPAFTFRAITKDGISAKPSNLSDYRGQTVVLWFFIKARTRG